MTPRERELLHYLQVYIHANDGMAPSLAEMAAKLGLASRSAAHRLVASLEEQGLVVRDRHHARRLRLARPPLDLSAVPDDALIAEYARRGFSRPNAGSSA